MPSETKTQDPADKLDYQIDWQADPKPGLAPGETIVTATWAVYDSGWQPSTGLVDYPELASNTDTTVIGWVSVAEETPRGAKFYFTSHIVTSEGREISWSIPIKIKEQ